MSKSWSDMGLYAVRVQYDDGTLEWRGFNHEKPALAFRDSNRKYDHVIHAELYSHEDLAA